MKLNKNKGKWWCKETYSDFGKPSLIDNLAYHFYCEDNTPMRCLPQVTVIHNKDHMFIKAYYKKSERILKIKKIKSQLFNDRN